jgi:hypothetical protein
MTSELMSESLHHASGDETLRTNIRWRGREDADHAILGHLFSPDQVMATGPRQIDCIHRAAIDVPALL